MTEGVSVQQRLAVFSVALAFSLDGQVVFAHRLVPRVVRDRLVQQGRLAAVCWAAVSVLNARAGLARVTGPRCGPGCS
jgi:hypothetical protein